MPLFRTCAAGTTNSVLTPAVNVCVSQQLSENLPKQSDRNPSTNRANHAPRSTNATAPVSIDQKIDNGDRKIRYTYDFGGPWGYRELLDILADSNHPEHEERLEWAGGEIDPSAFDPTEFAENLRLHQTMSHQALADLIDFDTDQ
jgi:hypothetical protein